MSVRVSCPGCGGPVEFKIGTAMVTVCPSCGTAVGRGDRDVEDLGKVAALVDTGTELKIWATGKVRGVGFRITGRTQLLHEAGGVWDEWYAAFDDGNWGWLAEAQGKFYLTFRREPETMIPDVRSLQLGDELDMPGEKEKFVVAETGTATVAGAEGELPYRYRGGDTYPYADLSGTKKRFATVSSDPPEVYVGRQLTLDELGVPPEQRAVHELREVAAVQAACPNCGGKLDLKAPDQTNRVGCPYCGSLLDCDRGNLKIFAALDEPTFKIELPLGEEANFGDGPRTLIGALLRSVTVEGTNYYWREYLLYDPRAGFEWLVESNGHWNRVKGVNAADVKRVGPRMEYDNDKYKPFAAATATVRGVVGECYWKVFVGEKVDTADFVCPPKILSREVARAGDGSEVNWSAGEYLTPDVVQKAFKLDEPLKRPSGVAMNQPFKSANVYKLGGVFLGLLILSACLMASLIKHRKVHEQTFQVTAAVPAAVQPPAAPDPAGNPPVPPPPDKVQTFFSEKFELVGKRNVRVTARCPSVQGTIYIEGDFVRDADGTVTPFVFPLYMETGTDEDGPWSESETEKTDVLSAMPPGTYSLRLEIEKDNLNFTGPVTVLVEQGVDGGTNFCCAFILLGAMPLVVGIWHLIFSSRRWSESSFVPFDEHETEPDAPEDDEPLPLAADP